MIHSRHDNLAHPIEPPARALSSLLPSNDRGADLRVFNSEFHLLIEHNLPFYFSRNSKKGGGTSTVLPQLYFLCSWIRSTYELLAIIVPNVHDPRTFMYT
jgi:hypothetical protein